MLTRRQESQITSTNPNRVTLVSGSVNVPGSPQSPGEGGVYIDNNEVPGMPFVFPPLLDKLS
jgi:phospholipase C